MAEFRKLATKAELPEAGKAKEFRAIPDVRCAIEDDK